MLRDFNTAVRAARLVRIAVVLTVAWIVVATAGCGIKGPLRPATPPSPTPAATDVGPPQPAADPDPSAPRKP